MKITPPSRFEELRENYGDADYAKFYREELADAVYEAEVFGRGDSPATVICRKMIQEIDEYLALDKLPAESEGSQ